MTKRKRDASAYSAPAMTEGGKKVIEEMHSVTVAEVERVGAFELTSMYHKLAGRTHEVMSIIRDNEQIKELFVRVTMTKSDNDEEEIMLFFEELQFLVSFALAMQNTITSKVCKKLGKTGEEVEQIMATEQLAQGMDTAKMRDVVRQMNGE
tara:strand:- start:716 stop:1168 length:453 start_codon:yes stop_codon:yes gene_type:complete